MSVRPTCVANRTNPFDYMIAAAKSQRAVKEDPIRWLPWNYQWWPTSGGNEYQPRPG
jgi:hypothetical protein